MEKLMKLKECSEYLQVSEKKVRRMIKDGKIPYLMIGKQYRFRKDMLDKYLDEGRLA